LIDIISSADCKPAVELKT